MKLPKCLILGAAGGALWYAFIRSVDFGPYPVAADAVTYAGIANSLSSLRDALTYAGDRTFGFPLFLYLLRRMFGIVGGDLPPERIAALQSLALLLLHFASSLSFYLALNGALIRRLGRGLNPVALIPLLVHPGLISHTAVLLTDTFATDLLMLAGCVFLGFPRLPRLPPLVALSVRGTLCGVILGWALAARPFFVASFAISALFGAVLAGLKRNWKTLFAFAGPLVIVAGLFLLPAEQRCQATFGKACLQNPTFASGSAGGSLREGLIGVRYYWSVRSRWVPETTTVMQRDWALVERWGEVCNIEQVVSPGRWVACVIKRPFLFPVFLGKKLIALLDNYFLHPYASDVTPTWTIWEARAFNVLAFIGFFCALGLLIALLRAGDLESLALAIPLAALLCQLPMHAEARYSLPTVPVCFASLVWVAEGALRKGRATLGAFLLASVVLSGVFFIQTHAWDREDLVLRQIEGQGR